jgi:protein-disulfide isomerase
MALKDQLTDALNSTPLDNDRRIATLRAALAEAEKCESDGEVVAVISRIITELEQKAASFNLAGQTELANNVRAEIDTLRSFLRVPGAAEPKAAATKTKLAVKPSAPAEKAKDDKSAPIVSRTQMIFAGFAAGVLVLAAIFYFFVIRTGSNDETLMASGAKQQISVFKDDHTIGSPTAPIIFLEYAAPSCPHCGHFNETAMPVIKKKYIDTGKVLYIYRVFPIMEADGAAEAIALCLPADNYFQFLDLLYRNQPKWDPEYGVTDVRGGLIQMARIAGMSAEKVDQCIADRDKRDRINRVAQDGETKYSIHAVPCFVVNGEIMQIPLGSTPLSVLQARFDLLLSKH